MSAKHALLGLLRDGPAYPYELANRLQSLLGPTWEINQGQLSRTIRGLEKEGLIERAPAPATDGRRRHVFQITDGGIAASEEWWSTGQSPSPRLSRRPLLLKISLAGPERLRRVLDQIEAYEFECAERLRAIGHLRDQIPVRGAEVHVDDVLLRLGLTGDLYQLEGELGWARHAHEMVSWMLSRDLRWPERDRSDPRRSEREDARRRYFQRMTSRYLHAAAEEDTD